MTRSPEDPGQEILVTRGQVDPEELAAVVVVLLAQTADEEDAAATDARDRQARSDRGRHRDDGAGYLDPRSWYRGDTPAEPAGDGAEGDVTGD